jgi:hypothetical protein
LVAIRSDAESPDWDLGHEEELVLDGGLRPGTRGRIEPTPRRCRKPILLKRACELERDERMEH